MVSVAFRFSWFLFAELLYRLYCIFIFPPLASIIVQFHMVSVVDCALRVYMYQVSTHGVDERMINVHYYYLCARKAHMRSTPSLSSFPTVAFEMVSMFV